MEFTNEFTIPLGVDDALDVLTDLERVAPCMPGATLESVQDGAYTGRVKVKVGPMALTYAGTAKVLDRDEEARTARIEASGREKRGSGTAAADVTADLREGEGGTLVRVTTDLTITGKPAQFGRGVMQDVGGKLIDRFAENLRAQLQEEQEQEQEPAAAAAAEPTPIARAVEQRAPRDEALDLLDVVGDATRKRVAGAVAAVVAVLGLVLVLRGLRGRRAQHGTADA